MQLQVVPDAGGRARPRFWRASPAAACAAAVALIAVALGAGGCGIAGGTGSLGPTTTQTIVQAHLTVDPVEGPIGTVFTLAAGGMTPGAAVQFEITFPGEGRAYPGNALTVADDGTASATYRATTANMPGPYVVRLTGPQGQLATGEFRVTDGKPLVSSTVKSPSSSSSSPKSTTKPGGTATSAKSTTTAKPSTTAPKATTTTKSPVSSVPTTLPPTTSPPTT
jgi:hypothetical protein